MLELPDVGLEGPPEEVLPEEPLFVEAVLGALELGELLLEELLDEELLDEELLDEELLLDDEELLEELLDGEDGDGIEGGCGIVGLDAEGHPVRKTQAATIEAASRPREFVYLLSLLPVACVIGPSKPLRFYRHPIADARPERCLAQATHNRIGFRVVCRELVKARQVGDASAFRDPEF